MNSDRMGIVQKLIIMWTAVLLIGVLFGVMTKSHAYYSISYNLMFNLLVTFLGYILVGILLGMHHYINENKKDGSWKIDWSLIFGFILPVSVLYVAFIFNILNISAFIISRLGVEFPLILGVIIGYTAVLALYKN
jgi:hypothetical protein